MCDYSLEIYRSRPARTGERYTLHRFPSGSKGFVSPGDCTTAVCIAPDARLRLSELSGEACAQRRLGPIEEVTFVHLEEGRYHDGVRFENGAELSLQSLPLGVTATLIEALEAPAPSIKAEMLVD